ncbi:hypothetical protein ACTQ49_14095 [Luteococcus sp. Sow4_B9]|uniref:hypothetical protein n=1 Tax=Luteococcus sp. Sow4_B9 TaxID=3438792 RepID=UPI003F9DEB3F
MPSMSVLVLLGTIALGLLVLVWTFVRWSMGQGARVLLRGIGTILVLVGMYVTGLAHLAGNGIRSIIDWAQRTPMDTPMMIGLGIAGTGLLFWLIGTVVRPHGKEQARATRASRKGASAPVSSSAPAGRPVSPTGASKAPAGGLAEEDEEIAAILDRRGIK